MSWVETCEWLRAARQPYLLTFTETAKTFPHHLKLEKN